MSAGHVNAAQLLSTGHRPINRCPATFNRPLDSSMSAGHLNATPLLRCTSFQRTFRTISHVILMQSYIVRTQKARKKPLPDFLLSLKKYFDFFYVIDLRKYAPIYGKKFRKKYFLGGHMSALGYLFTADMVITYVDFIINRHPEDFAQIGFIGKGVYNSLCKFVVLF